MLSIFLTSGLSGCAKKDDVLNVAINAEFSPFEFLKNGEIVGFDIDLMGEIAKKLDMKFEIKNMDFEEVIEAVKSEDCDVAISAITITPKRIQEVEFSAPYYTGAAQIIMVKEDDTVFTGTKKSELDEQLKNKKIGVCKDYVGEMYVSGSDDAGYEKIEGVQTTVYLNISMAVTALKSGAIDAIVIDNSIAKQMAGEDKGIKVIDVALTIEEYAIVLKKENKDLKLKIDKAISELKSDGVIDRLLSKWELN